MNGSRSTPNAGRTSWQKTECPLTGSIVARVVVRNRGQCFVMASFCGGRPHQRQLEQYLTLLRVFSAFSGVLALLCEPVEDNRDVHRTPPRRSSWLMTAPSERCRTNNVCVTRFGMCVKPALSHSPTHYLTALVLSV